MKGISLALACSALCVSSGCYAQPAPAPSVQLSKVIMDTETQELKSHVKVGTICLLGGGPLKPKKEKRTQNYEHYDQLFSGRMKERGFNVVTVSGDLFASEDNGRKGDFLVGATLRPDTINICSSVNGEKGEVTVAVEWQIYDRAAQKVVETVTQTGRGEQPKFARDGLSLMIDRAFVASLDAAIAQGAFQKYLGPPAH